MSNGIIDEEKNCQEFYPNETLRASYQLINNQLQGDYKIYYKNSKLKACLHYDKGKLANYSKFYNEKGVLVQKIRFLKSELQGRLACYQAGKLQMISYYWQGELHGSQLFFSPQRRVLIRRLFVRGLQEGDAYHYYEDGKLAKKEQFLQGELHGRKEVYDQQGGILLEEYYQHGKLIEEKRVK